MKNIFAHQLGKLRTEQQLSQNDIASQLFVSRQAVSKWENGDRNISLKIADELSILYNVPLAYIFNLTNKYDKDIRIKPVDYNILISNLLNLKKKNNLSYREIATSIGVSSSNCYKYFNNKLVIPVHILIDLSLYFKVDVDELCFKL